MIYFMNQSWLYFLVQSFITVAISLWKSDIPVPIKQIINCQHYLLENDVWEGLDRFLKQIVFLKQTCKFIYLTELCLTYLTELCF